MKFTIEMNIYELNRSIKSGTLEALVADVQAHEEETRRAPKAEKEVKAPAPDPEKKEEKKAPDILQWLLTPTEEKNEDTTPEITEVEVRAKFVELSKKGKKAELKTLLDEMGVSKVSELKPEQYAETMKRLEAI